MTGKKGGVVAVVGVVAAAIALACGAACVPGPSDELDVNHAPVARIVLPQLWPASEPLTVDGSFSDDPDGDALRFSVDWGDGTPSAQDDDGIALHTFGAPGTYDVQLQVEDEADIPARVDANVVLVGDDDSACDCDLGCFDDAVCTDRGCLVFRSSLGDEDAPAGAFDDALTCP